MNFKFQHNIKNNYLIIENPNLIVNDFRINMIIKNTIPELLDVSASCISGKMELSYTITSTQSLKNVYDSKKLNYHQLSNIIKSIISLIDKLPGYLLKIEEVVFDPEMIFVDYNCEKVKYIYYPGYENDTNEELKKLSQELILVTDHSDSNAVVLVYKFFEICSESTFLVNELKNCIEEIEKDDNKYIKNEEENSFKNKKYEKYEVESSEKEEQNIYDKDESYDDALFGIIEKVRIWANSLFKKTKICEINKERKKFYNDIFDEDITENDDEFENSEVENNELENNITTIINENESDSILEEAYEEETMYIGDIMINTNRSLLSMGEQENIYINKFPFIIGKIKNRVDYVFNDKKISRMHVRFYKNEDRYYLEDLNSKNGTYINDKEIEPLNITELKIGDKVSIADFKYIFR